MFAFLVNASLKVRLLVVAIAAVAMIYGGSAVRDLQIDVLPDLNKGLVTILTEAPGLAPEEVDEWWRNPKVTVHPRILDSLDGWEPGEVSFQPAARSVDGRLWFANQSAVQVIDPDRLPHNTLRPPVQIEGIEADRKEFPPAAGLRLPPLT